MNKYFFIIQIFFISNIYSLEMKCKFEEVYSDGTVQNGLILVKGQNLRYQYNSNDLFTLFHNNHKFFLVRNNNTKIINNLIENTELINELLIILNNYPEIIDNYVKDDLHVKIEKDHLGTFVKRISINSPAIKMSVYFNQCKISSIENHFFNHNPFFEYKLD